MYLIEKDVQASGKVYNGNYRFYSNIPGTEDGLLITMSNFDGSLQYEVPIYSKDNLQYIEAPVDAVEAIVDYATPTE